MDLFLKNCRHSDYPKKTYNYFLHYLALPYIAVYICDVVQIYSNNLKQQPMTTRKQLASDETWGKYADYLNALKQCDSFNMAKIRKSWKIGHSLNIWLLQNRIIENIGGGEYKWIGKKSSSNYDMLEQYFKDYRAYSKKNYIKKRAKALRAKNRALKQASKTTSVDKLMAKNFQRDIDKIKNSDAKRQQEIWTDQDAINFLKQSPTYTYEIYRVVKEQI